MCGLSFREDRGQAACESCPLRRACRYIRCPRCGYENPATPGWIARARGGRAAAVLRRVRMALAEAFGRLGGGREAEPPGGSASGGIVLLREDGPGVGPRLSSLAPGARATVEALVDPASREGAALAGLGVLPGASLVVLQRYPAWVVRVDHAELALDDRLAAQVRVRTAAE